MPAASSSLHAAMAGGRCSASQEAPRQRHGKYEVKSGAAAKHEFALLFLVGRLVLGPLTTPVANRQPLNSYDHQCGWLHTEGEDTGYELCFVASELFVVSAGSLRVHSGIGDGTLGNPFVYAGRTAARPLGRTAAQGDLPPPVHTAEQAEACQSKNVGHHSVSAYLDLGMPPVGILHTLSNGDGDPDSPPAATWGTAAKPSAEQRELEGRRDLWEEAKSDGAQFKQG